MVARCESVAAESGSFRIYRMRVIEVVRGDPGLQDSIVEAACYRELAKGREFWIVAHGIPTLEWAPPTEISPETLAYLRGLSALPENGVERLSYFLPFLQHADDLVSADAFKEFAKAPLKDIAGLKEKLDRQWIVNQLRDPSAPLQRRSLYWVLLSQCGTAADMAVFDELVRDRKTDSLYGPGLDAAIACYISLGGEEALTRIEHDYLVNPHAEYADTHAAIVAIRVHGEQIRELPRGRLAAALRSVLERPVLADLVLADLARWEDWSVINRIVELFETATDETSFFKSPAVRYLKACPLPAAAEALDKVRAIDPDAVRRVESSMMLASGQTTVPVAPTASAGDVVPSVVKQDPGEDQQNSRAPQRVLPWLAVVALLLCAVLGTRWILTRRRVFPKPDPV